MESLREKAPAFVSYAREDSEFALRLAADLKAKGAKVWVDQLDISPGRQWDREVEHALLACSQMLVILSPAAFESNNVRDEVSFALEERKTVIPVLHQDCPIPFRLRRVQYVDFRLAYEPAVEAVLGVVRAENQVGSVTTPINHPISASLRSTETSDPGAAERENAETTWKAQQERLNRESVEVAPKAERDPRKREKAVPKAEKNRLDREKAQAAPVSSSSDRDQKVFVDSISKGLLVPVLGGDINLCGRPVVNGVPIRWDANGLYYPPTTGELALELLLETADQGTGLDDPFIKHFLKQFLPDEAIGSQSPMSNVDLMSNVDFANVCQYIQLSNPSGEILRNFLPDILGREYQPTPVHDFLVRLAQYEPAAGHPDNRPYPCIVTACFDQVLEQQLRKNNVPFHLVAFVLGSNGGVFEYTAPGDAPEERRDCAPKDFGKMMEAFREHAVVIKLNGGIDPVGKVAITEDDYIDYLLSHRGLKELLPEMLLAKLTRRGRIDGSHLLFLGYSLRHWNLRVSLRRIWSECLETRDKRWTVLLEPGSDPIERRFWEGYLADIKQLDLPLGDYMNNLTARLAPLPSGASGGSVTKSAVSAVADTKPVRDGVFISYSHKDIQVFKKLNKMLVPVRRKLNIWHDNMIEPGAQWRDEIKKALASAKAAILLVSPDFLASDFIQKNELPPLLEAAKTDGCRILWIKLKECLVKRTVIEDYQALYAKALMNLNENERNEALCGIAEKICDILSDQADAQS